MNEFVDAVSVALMITFMGFLVSLALLMITLVIMVIRAECRGAKGKHKK